MNRQGLPWVLVAALSTGLTACGGDAPARAGDADARLDVLIGEFRAQDMARDPTLRTLLTETRSEPDWTPVGDAYAEETLALARQRSERIGREIDRDALSPGARMRHDILVDDLRMAEVEHRVWRNGYTYSVNPFNPVWMNPQTLTRHHKIQDAQDARNYVSRLSGQAAVLDQVLAVAEERHGRGIVMMRAGYEQLAGQARDLSQGAPCAPAAEAREHVLLADLKQKLEASELAPADRAAVIGEAEQALTSQLCPAYARFSEEAQRMAALGREDGLWTLPDGRDTYRDLIELSLGDRVDPDRIHELGLREVASIQAEIRDALAAIGFEGSQADFNAAMLEDPRHSVANDEAGYRAYEAYAQERLDFITPRLPQYFHHVPSTPLVIKWAATGPSGGPPSAGSYYTDAPPDRSASAIYNLAFPPGPQRRSLTGLATEAYHEGVPGHHMQRATAFELRKLPELRNRSYASYTEGWGLYAEQLAEEMGGFEGRDYARIGWMQARLERAVRLVLDTGLNHLGWSQQQALDYQREAMGEPGRINRFVNWPGQALGYYWGYLDLLRLRAQAQEALGEEFDLRDFHDVVLRDGARSLAVLQRSIDDWIESSRPRPR